LSDEPFSSYGRTLDSHSLSLIVADVLGNVPVWAITISEFETQWNEKNNPTPVGSEDRIPKTQPEQRFRCYNCDTAHEFVSSEPVCPQCGADARKEREQRFIVPLVTIHFDPPHPVIRGEGQHVMACTGRGWPPGTTASGETTIVSCTACRETEVFKAVEAYQHAPWPDGQKSIDEQVSGIRIDPPPGLDYELAGTFRAVANGIRECTRLVASIPHLWRCEEEYPILATSLATVAKAAEVAYLAVDIRLRRAGGPNNLLAILNDILTIRNNAPVDPSTVSGGVNAILTRLYTTREERFRRVNGLGCIEQILNQLAAVPPAGEEGHYRLEAWLDRSRRMA